jgi:hypothetical protein
MELQNLTGIEAYLPWPSLPDDLGEAPPGLEPPGEDPYSPDPYTWV